MSNFFGDVRHCERSRVRHRDRIRAGAVGAVRVLCAEAPLPTAPAALTVQRGDLRLTEVCQDALAAGGGSQGHAVPGGLALSVVSQQTVDVL